jgi:hypothetical protein
MLTVRVVAKWRQLLGSSVVAAAAGLILADARAGSLDTVDAIVLIVALMVFARALIRLASESGDQAARSR